MAMNKNTSLYEWLPQSFGVADVEENDTALLQH